MSGPHWLVNAEATAATFSTTTVRSGLRSLRCNTSASKSAAQTISFPAFTRLVGRFYLYFATLPSADTTVATIGNTVNTGSHIRFSQADSKIYAAVDTTLGATGVAVTTGIWYRIDFDFFIDTAGNDTSDVKVDGTACGQAAAAGFGAGLTVFNLGMRITATGDLYFDDCILSTTAADYPLGAGYILSYIPNADGSHNVAGANDFERTLTGTDIDNTTTDAYLLVDDRPLESVEGDFINGKTPFNSTDYVEIAYEDSVEAVAPRSVEAIVGYHDAGGAGTENFSVTLRDSGGGTTADIMAAAARNVGAAMSWDRAHFTTIPGGGAWTLAAFNALRSRFLVSDASPDVYLDGLMLEAEYAPVNIGGEHPITEWPMRRRLMVLAH